MRYIESLEASLSGKFDTDDGGRQPMVRFKARQSGRRAIELLAFVDHEIRQIEEAHKAKVLTEDDVVWLSHLQTLLNRILGKMPHSGMLAATRARQGGR